MQHHVILDGHLTYRRCKFSKPGRELVSVIGGPRRRFFELNSNGTLSWEKGTGHRMAQVALTNCVEKIYSSFPSEYAESHRYVVRETMEYADAKTKRDMRKEERTLLHLQLMNAENRLFTLVFEPMAMATTALHLSPSETNGLEIALIFEASSQEIAHTWMATIQHQLSQSSSLPPGSLSTVCSIAEAWQTSSDNNFQASSPHACTEATNFLLCPETSESDNIQTCATQVEVSDSLACLSENTQTLVQRSSYPAQIGVLSTFQRRVAWDPIPETRQLEWCSSLFQAARTGDIGQFMALMEQGASIYDLDERGRTVAHEAVLAGDCGLPVLALISQCAENLLQEPDVRGDTPLHLSVIRGDISSTKLLLETAVAPTITNNEGWTPLSLVSSSNRPLKRLVMLYRDSKGISTFEEGDENVDLERIMQVWGAFFSNALKASLNSDNNNESLRNLADYDESKSDQSSVELIAEASWDADNDRIGAYVSVDQPVPSVSGTINRDGFGAQSVESKTHVWTEDEFVQNEEWNEQQAQHYEPQLETNGYQACEPAAHGTGDWVLYWSCEYQHNYWYNTTTGESSWCETEQQQQQQQQLLVN